jgi:lysozyme family protein
VAHFAKYLPELLKHEGGYVNDPTDRGGATKYGITLSTWKKLGYDKDLDGDIDAEDIKLLTKADAGEIAKRQYWDYFWADQIQNQSVAEFIVDWGYNSGVVTVAIIVQKLISVKADGVFGNVTVSAINRMNPELLFEALKIRRTQFVERIVENNPSQIKFLKGWKNRINSFQFRP